MNVSNVIALRRGVRTWLFANSVWQVRNSISGDRFAVGTGFFWVGCGYFSLTLPSRHHELWPIGEQVLPSRGFACRLPFLGFLFFFLLQTNWHVTVSAHVPRSSSKFYRNRSSHSTLRSALSSSDSVLCQPCGNWFHFRRRNTFSHGGLRPWRRLCV